MPAIIRVRQVMKPRMKKVIVTRGRSRRKFSAHQLAHQNIACPEGNELSGRWSMSGGREESASGRGRTGSN